MTQPCIVSNKDFPKISYVMETAILFWPVLLPGGSFVSFHYIYVFYSSRAFIWYITHPCIPCNKDFLKYLMILRRPFCFLAVRPPEGRGISVNQVFGSPIPLPITMQYFRNFDCVQNCYAHSGFPDQLIGVQSWYIDVFSSEGVGSRKTV